SRYRPSLVQLSAVIGPLPTCSSTVPELSARRPSRIRPSAWPEATRLWRGWKATAVTRAPWLSSSGLLPIGPLPLQSQTTTTSAPPVASQRPSRDQEKLFGLDGYPLIRMSAESASRQPCISFSCVPVMTNLPSGDQVTATWELFQLSRLGVWASLFTHQRLTPP